MFVLYDGANEEMGEQFQNAMINNWYPGQWSLEVNKNNYNPLESSQRLWYFFLSNNAFFKCLPIFSS